MAVKTCDDYSKRGDGRMTNLGKREIATTIAKKTGVSDDEARNYLDAIISNISKIIKEQGRLKINNFGKFTTRWKTAREGRNPKTGDPVTIKARKVVTFTSSKCTRY